MYGILYIDHLRLEIKYKLNAYLCLYMDFDQFYVYSQTFLLSKIKCLLKLCQYLSCLIYSLSMSMYTKEIVHLFSIIVYVYTGDSSVAVMLEIIDKKIVLIYGNVSLLRTILNISRLHRKLVL